MAKVLSKKKEEVFSIDVFYMASVDYSGEVLEVSEGAIKLRYKKPRSSKYLIEIFPKASLLAWSASETESGFVLTKPRKELYGSYEGSIEIENGVATITSLDGDIIEVDAPLVEASVLEDSEKSHKKVNNLKPKSKPAKVKDDDEDNDDFDDD